MIKKVLILFPRLDRPFKDEVFGPELEAYQRYAPVREHWLRFLEKLVAHHVLLGHHVEVITRPLAWFDRYRDYVLNRNDPEFADNDIIYVPHRDAKSWPHGDEPEVRYYMQMVFPRVFQVDREGWCATASDYPLTPPEDYRPSREAVEFIRLAKSAAFGGVSKFDGVDSDFETNKRVLSDLETLRNSVPHGFVFMPLQIPHDLSVTQQSEVGMIDAMEHAMRSCHDRGITFVAKVHPLGHQHVREISERFTKVDRECGRKHLLLYDGTIQAYLKTCSGVMTVNSGAGLEALLHARPVASYGLCDYDEMCFSPEEDRFFDVVKSNDRGRKPYPADRFISYWYENRYDTKAERPFEKLEGRLASGQVGPVNPFS